MYYTAIFQGGGMKGLAFLGAMLALEEKGFIPLRAAGTSVGALIASLVIAGYKSKEILDIMEEIDIPSILTSRKLNIKDIISSKGLYSIKPLEDVVAYFCSEKGIYTFKDTIMNGKIRLKMVTTDIKNKVEVVLPDQLYNYGINLLSFPVSKAVSMSSVYPGYFKPIQLNGGTFIDGGLVNNFPYSVFDYEKKDLVIGFVLQKNKIKNIPSHIKQLTIDTRGFKTLDFKMSKEKQVELINIGYRDALNFLKELAI